MGIFYLLSFLISGALVVASLVLGHEDVDSPDADGPDVELFDVWLPFASLRFWTFVLAFGGLTGTLLTLFDLAPVWATAVAAAVVGWSTGASVTWAIRKLRRDDVSSEVRQSDWVGSSATVLLPIARGRTGKVRLQMKGRAVDATAETDDDGELAPDGEVLVYEVRDDGVLLVTENKRRRVS